MDFSKLIRRALAAGLFATLAAVGIDAAAQVAQAPIPVGTSPIGIAVNPITNKIYVTNSGSDSVTVINGATGATTTIPVGDYPWHVGVNPVTNRVYVSNVLGATVSIIDGATDTVSSTQMSGGSGWTAVDSINNRAYILRYGGGDEVNVFLGDAYTVTSATRSYEPISIALNPVNNWVYIVHFSTGDVVSMDMTTPAPYPPYKCPDGSGGFKPQPAEPPPAGSGLPDPGAGPCINVPDKPMAVAINPVTNRIYAISNGTSDQISVINGTNNTFTSLTASGLSGGKVIAVNPVTNKVYAAFATAVAVIDGATGSIVATLPTGSGVGSGPAAIGVNVLTNKVYVANSDGTLMVIDGATNATATVGIPAGANAISVNPLTNMVYVLHSSGSVTPVQGNAGDTTSSTGITTTITALGGNTSGPSGSITLNASSSMTPAPLNIVRKVYYRILPGSGAWVEASGSGPWTASYSGLAPGSYTIQAFATNGLEAANINTDMASVPVVGNVQSYNFTVSTPAKVNASISLGSSQNPSTVGASVTFTSSVSGSAGTATGAVTFRDGGAVIGGCVSVPLSSGSAACSTSSLTVGAHSITAEYSGDAAYNPGASSAVNQQVNDVVTPPTGTNFALSSNGGTATASSTYSSAFPPSATINGDRAGMNWGGGSGWNDATAASWPDWLQIDFNGQKTLNRVVVYTLQDAATSPSEPTDSMTFTSYGIQDFTVEGWNGASWVVLATVTNNNLVKRTVTFADFTTTRIRINVTRSMGGYTHITEVEAWGTAVVSGPPPTNVALAANGGVASASSTYGSGFAPSAVNNGDRAGMNWGNGSGWNDGTASAYPDWLQVTFNGQKTVNQVVVYTLQDNATSPSEPTDGMTFTSYGIVDFTVEAWNGASWVVVGTVTNNNLVKRTVNFPDVTTDRVRINISRAFGGYSHVTELEVYGVPASGGGGGGTNVALATAGATASASSTYSPAFAASAVINGDRAGANWGNGSGWNDGTAGAFPDWVQVNFNGTRTIDRVVVYTLQDSATSPSEPTDSMTFTSYGVVDFTVEAWNGSAWVVVGTVTNNNLVKRTVSFSAVSTDRIRINVTRALGGYTHITEVEAFGS